MAELYVGRRGSMVISLESPRGTKANPNFAVPYNELSFDNKTVKQEIGGAYGSIQAVRDNKTTKRYGEGSFGFDLEDTYIGAILSAVFGRTPTTTGATNFVHQFSVFNSNLHQSMNVTIQDPNITGQFPLAMINSWEVSVEPEGVVSSTVSLRSKAGADVTAVTANYANVAEPFIHADCSVRVAANEAGLNAAVPIDVTGLTLSVSKNVSDFNDIGSLTDREITNNEMRVEGTLTLGYTNQTFRDYDLTDGIRAIEIRFQKSANNSLTIVIPTASFEGWEANKALDEIVTQQITFKGVWKGGDFIKATLRNQTASYLTV